VNRYGASGPTAATAAAADNAIATLWNPSTTKRIAVSQVHLFKTAAGAADIPRLRRATARGTASTSYTPGISADFDRQLAPESGAIVDLAYSVQPTFEGTALRGILGALTPGSIGAGIMWVFDRTLWIPAGAGLSIVTGSVLAYPIAEAAFIWDE
jgi:hypothetical protein